MREAAAHKKRLRKEAKSGLGRLEHDDQTIIADLPRDGREECHGSNNVGSKGKGHGGARQVETYVPVAATALRGGSKQPCAAGALTAPSLHCPLRPLHRPLDRA